MKKRDLLLLFALCSMLFATGCSFPRVIILKDPLTPEEHLNLGVTYEQQGDFDNAIKEYNLAAKNLPGALLYLGNAHFQKALARRSGLPLAPTPRDPRRPAATREHSAIAFVTIFRLIVRLQSR